MSDSEYVKKWTVNDDGTLNPVSISTIADLSDNNVFIIVDENARKIFIWKGEKAPVRRKFISAKAAQQMRQEQYGMVYRIESLDAGLEGHDFLSIFGAVPPAASAPEISEEAKTIVTSRPVTPTTPTAAAKPAPTATPKLAPAVAPRPAPTAVQKPAPAAAPKLVPAVELKPKPVARKVKETEVVVTRDVVTAPTTPLEEITVRLRDLEIPPNLEREIVIIGNTVFSVIKEHLHLFSKDVVKLEPMDDLPAGIFPAEHYQVRVFVENGKVLFIEMLRQKTRSERDEFIDDMRQQLQDLSKMGL
ncbi:MAG: hypothetical protein ACFE9L_00410 [Candidatus Hodarchaeota archaeon]